MISVQNLLLLLSGNKWRMLLILLLLFFLNNKITAQTDPCSNAKIHIVEKGQTIYGITKQYNITQDAFHLCNPEVAKDGLKTGSEVKIPAAVDESKPDDKKAEKSFKTHEVKAKETVYGISKKYDMSSEELIKLNPEIEGGLKVGMILKIREIKNKEKSDEQEIINAEKPIIKSEVSRDENISNSEITNCKPLKPSEKSTVYKIGLLLPFHATSGDQFNPKSKIGIDFFQGVKFALDSLRKSGMFSRLYVFDTKNDTAIAHSLVRNGKLNEMDLIIGPLFSSLYAIIAKFGKEKQIPVISPFVQSESIIRNNSYAIKVSPDNEAISRTMATYIQKKFKQSKIILASSNLEKDISLTEDFKKALSDFDVNYNYLVYNSFAELSQKIEDQKSTLIIFNSTAQAQVYDIIAKLNGLKNKDITLFGLAEWNNFENIEYQYLNNLNFHYATASLPDFHSKGSKDFQTNFRDEYKTEVSVFALQGFDVGYYFGKALFNYGKSFHNCLSELKFYKGLNTSMKFVKLNTNKGFENTHVMIVKIDDLQPKIMNDYE